MQRVRLQDHRSIRRASGVVLTAMLVVTACGGGDETATTTTVVDTSVAAPTSTAAPAPSTDAPVVTAADTSAPTTSELPAGPVMPLSGLPVEDEINASLPALVAKIDNHPSARPQFGLNSADIVFEENVEQLTRFAAVFQGPVVDRIGPIRSGRTQDVDLLGSFDSPLFVWSGGNPNVTKAIVDSDLISLSPSSTRSVGFFREQRADERTEHTLYARMTEMYASFTPPFAPPPRQQFLYRERGESAAGRAVAGADIAMDRVAVEWRWDATSSTYLRDQDGRPHDTADGGQVNAVNVVVLEVEYLPSPADARSPEAQTVGSGTAYVLTGGVLVTGTWSRNDRSAVFELRDESGAVIALTPGRTWVELARRGKFTPVD